MICVPISRNSPVKGLDAPLSAHGHEDRRVNRAMTRGQLAQPRFGPGILLQQLKHPRELLLLGGGRQF